MYKRRKMSEIGDVNIDTDDILNIEEQYYDEGYREGQNQSTSEQYKEGKEFGYQTGFQRFLIVGYVKGLYQYWQKNIEQYDKAARKSIQLHLALVNSLINDLKLTNGDAEVAAFEKTVVKIRNKLRVLASLTKESWKINQVDNLMKEIGGQPQVSENVDDLW